MLRILHVIRKMDRAGAETLLMNIYRNIDRSVIQFDFAVHSDEKGDYEDEITQLGGRIFRMPPYKVYNGITYRKFWRGFFSENDDWDIIHGHMRSSAGIYLDEAKKRGIYAVAHSHSVREKGLYGILFSILTHKIRKIADYFFGCSAKALKDAFGSDIVSKNSDVILNGIEIEKYVYLNETAQEYKKEFGIKDELVIGHVGRFSKVKNHKFIIDVFYEILKKKNNCTLLLVGRGEDEEKIKNYSKTLGIDKKIRFLGIRDDINNLMMCIDVFIFPSLWEGLGIACIEAQASGANTFISTGVPEEAIVSDNCYRMAIEMGPEAWAEKILKTPILSDISRSLNAGAVRKKGYDIAESSNILQKFYLEIAKQKNSNSKKI